MEYFFVWEEGRRHAFYVTEANVPLFRSVAEDYVIEPDGPDCCRFTWTVALEPTPLGRPGAPLNGILFKRLFAQKPDATSTLSEVQPFHTNGVMMRGLERLLRGYACRQRPATEKGATP